jgi:PAS domain S-box-containing protein
VGVVETRRTKGELIAEIEALRQRLASFEKPDREDLQDTLGALRRSEQRYRALVEMTSDLVAELDAEGRVVFISPSCEEMLGYAPEQLIGTTPFGLLHDDDVEPLAQRFLDRIASRRRSRHGRVFRVRHRDGSWRWLQGGGVNYETLDGETHIVAVCRDVTDHLQAAEEQMKLEQRVQQSQRLESLGMLAAGISHDFNNLLTPILGGASLALMDLPSDSPARPRLEKIQRAAHHAATLTHQLLDYAGLGGVDAESVDLSGAVLDMDELLRSAVSKRAELVFELEEAPPPAELDRAQLAQLLLNVVANASDAIEASNRGRGRIVIRSGRVMADRKTLSQMILGDGLPAGTYVFLEVEDDGCGMDADTRSRVFDPFFTTRFTGRGLGLAAGLGIVRKHSGAIAIESAVGQGTRIRLLFPARPNVPAPAVAVDEERSGQSVRGMVLVADDDDGARELLTETLERAGMHVLAAGDGIEAVNLFRAHANEIRLVLLDRTMPGASGEETFGAVRTIRPDVPVLLVSGYADEDSPQRRTEADVTGFLQKPFLPEILLERVRGILDR